MRSWIGPLAELLPDPDAESRRRVGEGIAEGQGTRLLYVAIGVRLGHPRLTIAQELLLLGRRIGGVRRERAGDVVEVHRAEAFGIIAREPRGDACAPVTALNGETVVAEERH